MIFLFISFHLFIYCIINLYLFRLKYIQFIIWVIIQYLLSFSHSVIPNSLRTPGLQHTRLPCSSPSPRVCSNSCLLSWWCHPTISSSVIPFSCPQSFPASGSFPMSWLFSLGGQSIRASASVSILPVNTQGWFPLWLTGLISSQFKGLSRVFSSTIIQKHQFFRTQPSLCSKSHIHTWLLEKSQLWLRSFISKVICLLFKMLSRLVITFLTRSKRLLISWLQSPSAVILEPKKIKFVTLSIVSPSICY